jgi:hypothetical protein
MMHRQQRSLRAVAFASLAWTLVPIAPIEAQSTRHSDVIRSQPRPTPMPASAFAHSAFGEIVRMGPTVLILRLRSGRPLTVDATEAIQAGRTSEPLFVGKLVVVTGNIDSRGTFEAQTVTRLSNLDSPTRPDH